MRKVFLIAALLALPLLFFWKEVGGALLQAAIQFKTGGHLSYRNVRFSDKKLIFEDLVFFDTSSPVCRFMVQAESIAVQYPLHLVFEKPRFTLSREMVKLLAAPSNLKWSGSIAEGEVNWSDGSFPSSRIGFLKNEKGDLFFEMTRGESRFQLKTLSNHLCVEWKDFPIELFFPDQGKGLATGRAEADGSRDRLEAVRIEIGGEALEWRQGGFFVRGALQANWEARHLPLGSSFEWNDFALATDRFRLAISKGAIENEGSLVRDVEGLATYQAGLGGKLDGTGSALVSNFSFPLSFEAKAALHPIRPFWSLGECHLGEGFLWVESDESWSLNWAHLGSPEISFLQTWISDLADWNWVSGRTGGKVVWEEGHYKIDTVSVENLHLQSKFNPIVLGCEQFTYQTSAFLQGGWGELFGQRGADWNGTWDPAAERIEAHGQVNGRLSEVTVEKLDSIWRGAVHLESLVSLYGTWIAGEKEIEIGGNLNGLLFKGSASYLEPLAFSLAIPQFSGEFNSWHSSFFPQFAGKGQLQSIEAGLALEGGWGDGFEIGDWSLACQFTEGHIPLSSMMTLEQVGFELHADPSCCDLSSIRGISHFSAADQSLEIPFEAPRIKVEQQNASFDIRCQRKTWDFLRLVGEKKGEVLSFDPARSHLMGWPIALENWKLDQKGIASASFKTALSLPLLHSLLGSLDWLERAALEGDLEMEGSYERERGVTLRIGGIETHWRDQPFAFDFKVEGSSAYLTMGPVRAAGKFEWDGDSIRIHEGRAEQEGISLEFEGKLNSNLQADFAIRQFRAEIRALTTYLNPNGVVGILEGKGCLGISPKGIEADLDITPQLIEFQGFKLENAGSVHLFLSSSQGAVLKGLEGKIEKEGLELQGKVGLCQIDTKRRHWVMENTLLHLPAQLLAQSSTRLGSLFDAGHELDLTAEIDCAFDFSKFSCEVKEGFFPIGGAKRHVKDLHLFYEANRILGDCRIEHQGQEAKLLVELEVQPTVEGRLILDDGNGSPLAVDWTYDQEGLSVQAMEGTFAGVEASFHAQSFDTVSKLIGSARIDFAQLSPWIHPDVAEVFQELKLGKGYELKGHLEIGRKNLSALKFTGIFSGKQVELFGYELRTLLGRADLGPESIQIHDLKISDSAGIMKIDQILIGSKNQEPWTLEIPKLVIQDLRPSLLHKPNEEPGPLLPLLVRHLTLTDFKGLLDEGSTYQAKGELTFVNSFKRGETVFDFPASVFGRIIGLDVDLLIPVKGDLSFNLKDGYFTLQELRDAFSEGKRSEFFLVANETSPRMDLDGNLQILIQMKQFVLFKFTDAFMISIEGKLNDPQFRLQKKRRFLSLGL